MLDECHKVILFKTLSIFILNLNRKSNSDYSVHLCLTWMFSVWSFRSNASQFSLVYVMEGHVRYGGMQCGGHVADSHQTSS